MKNTNTNGIKHYTLLCSYMILLLFNGLTLSGQDIIKLNLQEAMNLALLESYPSYNESIYFQRNSISNDLFFDSRKPRINLNSSINSRKDFENGSEFMHYWTNSLQVDIPIVPLNSNITLVKDFPLIHSGFNDFDNNGWGSWRFLFRTGNLTLPNRFNQQKRKQDAFFKFVKNEYSSDRFYIERDIVLAYFELLIEQEKNDLLTAFKAELGQSKFLLNKIGNQLAESNVSLLESERDLKLLLNINNSHDVAIELPTILDTVYIEENIVDSLINNNVTLLSNQNSILDDEISYINIKRSIFSPQLEFTYINENDLLSFSSFNQNSNRLNFRASVNIPILNWGIQRKRVESRKLELEQSKARYEFNKVDISNEINVLKQEINSMPVQLNSSKSAWDESILLYQEVLEESEGKANDLLALKYAIDTQLECLVNYYSDVRKYYECIKRLSALCLYDFENKIDYSESSSWEVTEN